MKTALLTATYIIVDSVNSEYLKENADFLFWMLVFFAAWDFLDYWFNYRNKK